MTGRWLLNLLLLLGLLAAGAAIRHDLSLGRSLPTLAEIFVPELRLIELVREGEPPLRIERTAIGWRLLSPRQVDADPSRIERLLAVLDAPVLRTFPAAGMALDELGLDPPRLRLRLDALHLNFGGTDPVGRHRYVETGGLVHLIEDRFHVPLLAPPLDYAAPWLLPRDFPPANGVFDGMPLDAATLNALATLTAERVEALTGDLDGGLLEISDPEGHAIRFMVSDDRRRWGRLDQRLRYVLAQVPALGMERLAPIAPAPADAEDTPMADTASQPLSLILGADPDAPLPGHLPDLPLPAVQLNPRTQDSGARTGDARDPELRGEPFKEPPRGFGQDPFDQEETWLDEETAAEPANGAEFGQDPFAPESETPER